MVARDEESRTRWRKSSRSGGGENCVEVAPGDPIPAVRDSKNPDGPMLRLDLANLLASLKLGRFHLS
jgi:Domain of unknown function (DUF397)